jgi:ferredoxin-NADP reductase
MLVKKYKSEVISIKNPFTGIYTVEFRSLSGRYKYNPGQFLHLALDPDYDGSGQWPESRCFSMQSNPEEENIRITYTVKGDFTKKMEQTLCIGSEVWLKLPFGDLFSQEHNKKQTVFIAGGTGITPFLSLFTHSSFKEYIEPNIYIGFRSPEYNIYKEELSSINRENLKIFYENHNGLINFSEILLKHGDRSEYFISGPNEMISFFKKQMKGIPECKIKTDLWN